MARYSSLIDSDSSLDDKFAEVCLNVYYCAYVYPQALADEVNKFGESQLLGLSKGALARGLFSGAFLLCLKILTSPKTKVQPAIF